MADILRVSTPVTTGPSTLRPDNTQTTNQTGTVRAGQASSVNVTDDISSEQQVVYDSGSVFQAFANRIASTPQLAQTLEKLLLGVLTTNSSVEEASVADSAPALLAELSKKLDMSESEILQNLLFQKDQSAGFGSKFFDVLRDITQNDNSADTQNYIGRFLKALDSYSTSSQTMNGIMSQLTNILDRIPRSYAEGIREAMGELILQPDENGLAENLKALKETILPMLGKYVASTNDVGTTRDRIELLMQDISRLNLSGKEELGERFTELLDYARYNLNLPQEKLNSLQALFKEVTGNHLNTKNDFIDSLAKALSHSEGLSTTSQTMVNDTINALLLNRSVYMPFNHIFLPFMFDGNFMFTEMWVEKDGSKGSNASEDDDSSQKRVYLNFDVQGLGKFQAAIGLQDNNIECLLTCPEGLSEFNSNIETDVAKIFARNGFTVSSVKSSSDLFKTELEVLRKIYSGRSSVDVTV